MKVDFSQVITDAKGRPLLDEDEQPITLGKASATALFAMLRGEEGMSGVERARNGALGIKVVDAVECDLSVKDLTLIKDRIGRVCPPLVVTRAWAMIDPDPESP